MYSQSVQRLAQNHTFFVVISDMFASSNQLITNIERMQLKTTQIDKTLFQFIEIYFIQTVSYIQWLCQGRADHVGFCMVPMHCDCVVCTAFVTLSSSRDTGKAN